MKVIIDVPVVEPALSALRGLPGVTFDCITPPEEKARPLDPARIGDADVLFCTVPPSNLAEMRRLRWIQIASTGYTQLFGLGLPERGIAATNARGCFDIPIAEWNVAMMVNLARDLRQMIRNQDGTVWDRGARFQREIRGLTVGLWGYGGIGRETARLAKQLGLRVHVLTRTGRAGARGDVYTVPGTGDPDGVLPDRVFGAGETTAFLAGLDFLVVALPLTAATEGLIGEAELRALPRHAHVLNPARGPIIREAALLRALGEGWIAGAALDTHYVYPLPPTHPLWRMPNVILTPHISGSSLSPHFGERLWDIFGQNLRRCQRGEPLLNLLTAAQLKGQ
ncbi:MAG TPA: D-2-hydroxyacid dehydrogenase [Opitutaceae bacterium]|nr:D-2-hydroxyacid dehydrogenase [Opitutaceae bacterium]HND60697.1 D-2-hydroxyacid dehydrogenase [Opitutaceae bacterium]